RSVPAVVGLAGSLDLSGGESLPTIDRGRTIMIRRSILIAALLLAGGGALFPCGGPATYPVGAPFAPYPETIDRVLGLDSYYGPYRPEQVAFLHPLVE